MRNLKDIRESGSAHGERYLFHKMAPSNLNQWIKEFTNSPNKSLDEK